MSTTVSESKPNVEDHKNSDGDKSKEIYVGNGPELRRSYSQTILWTCAFGVAFAPLIVWMCIIRKEAHAIVLNVLTAVLGLLIGSAFAMF